MIQDYILAICSVVGIAALLPQVHYNWKVKVCKVVPSTSLPTSISMWVVGITFFTLDLWVASVLAVTVGTLWAVILVQYRLYR